jgi:hypothetical protein
VNGRAQFITDRYFGREYSHQLYSRINSPQLFSGSWFMREAAAGTVRIERASAPK